MLHFSSRLVRLDLSLMETLILARQAMISAGSPHFQHWSFDVSSLMVLLGESEEIRYRLAGRSLSEAIVAAPAAGIQCYLKSYDVLQRKSDIHYFSPYGCKSAPLRNMTLDNVIRQQHLLEDGHYSTYRIRVQRRSVTLSWLMMLWVAFTWLSFIAISVVCAVCADVTWIGLSTCVVFTSWSVLIRLVEYHMAYPLPVGQVPVSRPGDIDAVIILGRSNSALVLEGSRQDIKHWTSCGIVYVDRKLCLSATVWQSATRIGTLLVLMFIFVSISNGSTIDQLLFIVSNILGQVNVLLGYCFSAKSCLQLLERVEEHSAIVETRTHVYARLLRQFKDIRANDWVEKTGLLPNTPAWKIWRQQVIEGPDKYPKELYNWILEEKARENLKRI